MRLLAALALLLVAAAPAAADPIPVGPNDLPSFIGREWAPKPVFAPLPPRHPFMAPNGSSNLHEDAFQTDASQRTGPLGRAMKRVSTFYSRECGSVTFDSRGRIVTVCVGLDRPILKTRTRIDEIYAKHTGKSTEEVHRDMERDRFFKSDEAVEYGLIDKVISSH